MTLMTHTALINEQRKFPRFDIQVPASIRLKEGIHYQGKTSNISNNGAFIQYSGITNITEETLCILTLYAEGETHTEEIKIKCVFKPRRQGGVGLEFKTMSADDFINFIYLLSSKLPDSDKYFAELKNNPGVKLVDEVQL
jgi:hypothetical protein